MNKFNFIFGSVKNQSTERAIKQCFHNSTHGAQKLRHDESTADKNISNRLSIFGDVALLVISFVALNPANQP